MNAECDKKSSLVEIKYGKSLRDMVIDCGIAYGTDSILQSLKSQTNKNIMHIMYMHDKCMKIYKI